MKRFILTFLMILFLSGSCFSENIISKFVNSIMQTGCRMSGDVSSFAVSVGSPCSMTYTIAGIEGIQLFTAYKWLCGKGDTDMWHSRTKKIGYIRSLFCVSYAIYGLFPANNINTQTACTYYCMSLAF